MIFPNIAQANGPGFLAPVSDAALGMFPGLEYQKKSDLSVDDRAAAAIRQQTSLYTPELVENLDWVEQNMGDYSIVNRAAYDTQRSYNQASNATALQNSRLGMPMSAAQTRAYERTKSLGVAKDTANYKNQARLGVLDRDLKMAGAQLNALNQVGTAGTEGLVTSAGLEQQRAQAADQLAAQNKQMQQQRLGGAISTGLAVAGSGIPAALGMSAGAAGLGAGALALLL